MNIKPSFIFTCSMCNTEVETCDEYCHECRLGKQYCNQCFDYQPNKKEKNCVSCIQYENSNNQCKICPKKRQLPLNSPMICIHHFLNRTKSLCGSHRLHACCCKCGNISRTTYIQAYKKFIELVFCTNCANPIVICSIQKYIGVKPLLDIIMQYLFIIKKSQVIH